MTDLPPLDPWPKLTVGKRYRDKYGKAGECIALRESDFGHRWGTMRFDDGSVTNVRSNLLTEVGDEPEAQPA